MEYLTWRETIKVEWKEQNKARRNYIKQHLQFSKRLRYIPTILRLATITFLCLAFYYMGYLDAPKQISEEPKICYYNLICPEQKLPATGAE